MSVGHGHALFTAIASITARRSYPEASSSGSRSPARSSTCRSSNAKLIVLGQTTATQLFGPSVDPVGRVARIHSTPFQVIGLLERKGRSPMGSDFDDTAIVPVGTFQTAIQGGLQKYISGAIAVSATSPSETSRAQRQIVSRSYSRLRTNSSRWGGESACEVPRQDLDYCSSRLRNIHAVFSWT